MKINHTSSSSRPHGLMYTPSELSLRILLSIGVLLSLRTSLYVCLSLLSHLPLTLGSALFCSVTLMRAQRCEAEPSVTPSVRETQRLAVLMLMNRARLTSEEVEYLTDLTRRAVSHQLRGVISVITRENIEVMLPEGRTLEECDAECEIKLGRELGADYTINGSVIRFGQHLRVTLKLHETRRGELVGTEVAGARDLIALEQELQLATQRLVRKLTSRSTSPSGVAKRRIITSDSKDPKLFRSGAKLIVTLRSDPPGASMSIDDVQRCAEGRPVCRVEVTEGAHEVTMALTDHYTKRASVNLGAAGVREVRWRLEPNFVTLKITTEPRRLHYRIDDKPHRGARSIRVQPNITHRVITDDRCYRPYGEEVSGPAGEMIKIKLSPKPRQGGLEVSARTMSGEPITAQVKVKRGPTGKTPAQLMVNTCATSMTVSREGYLPQTVALSLREGEVSRISVKLERVSDKEQENIRKAAAKRFPSTASQLYTQQRLLWWVNAQAGAYLPDINANPSPYLGAQVGVELHSADSQWFLIGKLYGAKIFRDQGAWGEVLELSYPLFPFNIGGGYCFGAHCLSLTFDLGAVLLEGTNSLFGEYQDQRINISSDEGLLEVIETDDMSARGALGFVPLSLRYTVPLSASLPEPDKSTKAFGFWRFVGELSAIPFNYEYRWFPTPYPGLYPVSSSRVPLLIGVGVEYVFGKR